MKFDVEVNWPINYFCNYDCIYCYQRGTDKKKESLGPENIQKVVDAFNATGLTWFIYISGGEPFFASNFVELCKKLTEKHLISINTNLSHQKVYQFADTIDPERVRCIHCSIHIDEMEYFRTKDSFLEKYKYFEEKGFYIFASYVLYPPFIDRFEQDYEFFKSHGIILRPKAFRGSWTKYQINSRSRFLKKANRILERIYGKNYPSSYTAEEKNKVLDYMDLSMEDGKFAKASEDVDISNGRLSDVYQDKQFLDGMPSFKGQMCGAGKTFVRMTPKGDVYRCYDDPAYMGNLFNGTFKLFNDMEKCKAKQCHCAYIGYRHVKEAKKILENGSL